MQIIPVIGPNLSSPTSPTGQLSVPTVKNRAGPVADPTKYGEDWLDATPRKREPAATRHLAVGAAALNR